MWTRFWYLTICFTKWKSFRSFVKDLDSQIVTISFGRKFRQCKVWLFWIDHTNYWHIFVETTLNKVIIIIIVIIIIVVVIIIIIIIIIIIEFFWFIFSGIPRDTEYLFVFSSNAGKHRPGKLRIRTLFT